MSGRLRRGAGGPVRGGVLARAEGVGLVVTSVVYFLPASYLLLYRGAIQRILAGGGLPAGLVVIAYIAVAVMAMRAG